MTVAGALGEQVLDKHPFNRLLGKVGLMAWRQSA
jgi:hypothetical protein